jgi:hypothetical protein
MSKVVKKVGKAIGKVVKGVVKGVKKVVKKVTSSKFFKVIAGAALVYFGGAALMGGLKGFGAGTGFFKGAATGIGNAWSSLTAAGSSALGGNFSQAAANLGAGAKGTTLAAQNVAANVANATANLGAVSSNVAPASQATANALANNNAILSAQGTLAKTANATQQAGLLSSAAPATAANTATSTMVGNTLAPNAVTNALQAQGALPATAANTANAVANANAIGSAQATLANTANLASSSPGLLSRAGSAISSGWNSLGPVGQYGVIQTVGKGISGGLAAKAEDDALREQLARYGMNIGTEIPMPVYNPSTGKYEYPNQATGVA